LREIERAISLLDIDQTRKLLPEIAYTIWVRLTQSGRPFMDDELPLGIRAWFARVGADIFDADEIINAAEKAKQRPDSDRLAKADRMAELLDLKYDDRQRLGIFTIGAIDKTKRQRANLKKKRNRENVRKRAEVKRREQNRPSRAEWLSQHNRSKTKPWVQAGISRSKWYRRLRRETGCFDPQAYTPSKQPVSPQQAEAPLVADAGSQP
jgi:hypothetical protein